MLRVLKVSVFDCLVYLKNNPELYSNRIKEILKDFVFQTTEDLYDTWEEANQYVLSPEIINKYIGGEMGINELQTSSAALFNEYDDVSDLMFKSVKGLLEEKGLLNKNVEDYLSDLKKFIKMRKKDPLTKTKNKSSEVFNYDFKAIKYAKYNVNPNAINVLKTPQKYYFFHDEKQKKHISNQVKLYSNQANGLGKLLVKSNTSLIFRQFNKF